MRVTCLQMDVQFACVEENYTAMAVSLPEAVLVPLKSNGKTFYWPK